MRHPGVARCRCRRSSGPQPATAKLPLHFEANQGQTDERVKFLARGSGYGLFLTSTESVLVLRKAEARLVAQGRVGLGERLRLRSDPALPRSCG